MESIEMKLKLYNKLLYVANYINYTRYGQKISVVHGTDEDGTGPSIECTFVNCVASDFNKLTIRLCNNISFPNIVESIEIVISWLADTKDIFDAIWEKVPNWKIETDYFIQNQATKADNLASFILDLMREDIDIRDKYAGAMEIVQNQASMIRRLQSGGK